jgi:hypothetical protein
MDMRFPICGMRLACRSLNIAEKGNNTLNAKDKVEVAEIEIKGEVKVVPDTYATGWLSIRI